MSNQSLQAKSFLATLFDFDFTSFLTMRFLKVIYAVLVAVIALSGVFWLVAFLSRGGGTAVLGLVLVPLVTLLYLLFARIYLELVALFFRIGENTSAMAAALAGTGAAYGQAAYAPGTAGTGPYGSGTEASAPQPPSGEAQPPSA
jgi:cellulose synthase/poly-beta-1,6-N-acetylglucosamine synthase-like glycosyltransferase